MADIPLVNPEGNVVDVDIGEAAGARAQGYTDPTQQQLAHADSLAEHGTALQQVVTGIEHAASAATFGISTGVERLAGVQPEDIEARSEANPVAGGLGTAVGILAPIALTAGAAAVPEIAGSTLAKVAANTAPTLIARAGQAAAGLIPAGTTSAGKVLARIGQAALGSAVEGAAYGTGDIVNEAMLGDPRLKGQYIAAHILSSAGIGGIIGGGLGALGEAVPAVFQKARDALSGALKQGEESIEKAAAKLNPGTVGPFQMGNGRVYRNMTDWMMDNKQTLIKLESEHPGTAAKLQQLPNPQDAERVIAAYGAVPKLPQEWEKYTNQTVKEWNANINAIDELSSFANKEMRPQETTNLVDQWVVASNQAGIKTPTVIFEDAATEANRISQRIRAAADQMSSEPAIYPAMYAPKLTKIADQLDATIDSSSQSVHPLASDMFRAIDEAKSELSPMAKFGKTTGEEHKDAISVVKGLRGDAKSSLENDQLWGPAAARQSDFNAATSEYLDATKNFHTDFCKKTVEKGRQVWEVDPGKVESWMKSALDSNNLLRTQRLIDYQSAIANYYNASLQTARNVNISNIATAVNKTKTLIPDMRQTGEASIGGALRNAEYSKQIENLPTTPLRSTGESLLHTAEAAGIGTLVTHALGIGALGTAAAGGVGGVAALYKGAKYLGDTASVMRHLVAVEKIVAWADNKIANGATRLLGVAGPIAAALRPIRGAAAASLVSQSEETLQHRYKRDSERINNLANNPTALQDHIEANTPGHADAPQITAATQAAHSTALQFLMSKMPSQQQQLFQEPLPPGTTEIAKWYRYYAAVENPFSILEQAAAGVLTQESVEAVKTVYPDLYNHMQQAILEKASSRKGVPYESLLMMSMILGEPLTPSLSPQNIPMVQSFYAKGAQRQPTSAPMKMDHNKQASRTSLSDRESRRH